MRKLMICLSALFFATFCVVTAMADPGSQVAKKYEENDEKIVIFIKGEGKTEEAAEAIQKKVEARIIRLEKASTMELERVWKEATLLLVGISEEETDWMRDTIEKWTGREGEKKKCSFFFLSSEEEGEKSLALWEERAEKEFHGMVVPGLFLTWDEKEREEELSYMDGWLTTAFTYKK